LSYGTYLTANTEEEEKTSIACVKRAYELGVNFFDTAEIYGYGKAEETLGKAIREIGCRREDVVITTKLMSCGPGVHDSGLSRKHIIEGTRNSLKRL
jgi:aryl-alcohol dehydrogenase-like predicted oxidoreductase